MTKNDVISDQLFNWSDIYEKIFYTVFTQKTKNTCPKTCYHSIKYSQRLFDRALQTLWETRMQMQRWARTWTQILSVNQSTWSETGTGLCALKLSGTSKTAFGKLPASSTYFGRNLQYKSGNITSQRKAVRNTYGYHCQPFNTYRHRNGRNYSCQYAPKSIRDRFRRNLQNGGEQ